MTYVFISYARKDTNLASQLIEKLRALEIDTWYDQDIDIGSPSGGRLKIRVKCSHRSTRSKTPQKGPRLTETKLIIFR